MGSPDPLEPRAGVWTLDGGRLIIAEAQAPATILVPTEQVRLLAVDLPLPSRAKRLAALPFAIEDRIAEPVDSVHIALGAALSPGRYLVGIVRHDVMAGWIEAAEEAGLGAAPMVPDVLMLPRPAEGWAVDETGGRAAVLASDGTGFAVPAALLRPSWEAAGRPPVHGYGAPLPDEMQASSASHSPASAEVAAGLAAGMLDLRQGAYAVRRLALPGNLRRRFAWIAAAGAAAHVVIALGDTLMLRAIADRREADTRAVAALAAPGVPLGDDMAATITAMLPNGSTSAPPVFVPLVTRLSTALAPVAGAMSVRAMTFEGRVLTLDLDAAADPALPGRIEAALKSASLPGQVVRSPDGSIRVTASAA
jgi:general secretion pathway protein L